MFKGSHYELIRNNWRYRLMCQMEDMRLELEPAWATPPVIDVHRIEDRLNDLETEVSRPGSIPRRYTDELNQLKGQVIYLRNKIAESSAKKNEGSERPEYTIN